MKAKDAAFAIADSVDLLTDSNETIRLHAHEKMTSAFLDLRDAVLALDWLPAPTVSAACVDGAQGRQ